jgi:hypothetical protein
VEKAEIKECIDQPDIDQPTLISLIFTKFFAALRIVVSPAGWCGLSVASIEWFGPRTIGAE